MLNLENLGIEFAGRWLVRDASYQFVPGERVGLVGRNGTGKSTLLRAIVGDLTPTEGRINRATDLKIAFFNQDLLSYETALPVYDVVKQAFAPLLALEADLEALLQRMEDGDTDPDLWDDYAHKQELFDHFDGARMDAQVHEVLAGLGIATELHEQPYSTFSGGWRMRVLLAKMLLSDPDLLLLDEPTNHLDLPSILWLEEYLKSYRGSTIIVSHDRSFLDRMVTGVIELQHQRLHIYGGDYAFYLAEKEIRSDQHRRNYEKQQDEIRQNERFIERFKAKASKATQAQSRVKALERMDRLEAPENDTPDMKLRFEVAQQPGREVLAVIGASKSYSPARDILKKTTAVIERGDKIALIGANGLGKSTLLRMLVGTEPFEGERKEGYNVNPAFFAQHQLEALTLDNTILQEMATAATNQTETQLRTLLGCFMFSGDEVEKRVRVLSGGEKSRVALAKTLLSKANLLMLDEPTNHLDINSIEVLIKSLQLYEGTLIVISHDRYFLNEIANKIWYIEDKEIKEYPGTYTEWDRWRQQKVATNTAVNGDGDKKEQKNDKREAKPEPKVEAKPVAPAVRIESKDKNRLKKLKGDVEAAEKEVAALETRKSALEATLASPAVAGDFSKLSAGMKDLQALQQQLDAHMRRWEEAEEALDNFENA